MKEIGGYFGLENFCGKEWYDNLVPVNNARNALVYIAKAKKIKKLYIPYFLCDSVSNICKRDKIEFQYYHITEDFKPLIDSIPNEYEYIYVVNYYGQISNEYIKRFKEKYTNVIFDNVQAFFQPPVTGIDTVYSCRKFFGVPDGGYISTDCFLFDLPKDESRARMKHILGRYETDVASDFYSDFKANDSFFNDLELRQMSDITHNILRAVDYESVRKKREDNFELLHSILGSLNRFKLIKPYGPYAYPFYFHDGMELKKKLASEKIYVATLWPNVLEMCEGLEKDYAENILPLPCDQRYDANDMKRMSDIIIKNINRI